MLRNNSTDPPMSKRFCKFFASGVCFKGEQCEYSHDRNDPSICKFYQKGLCAYGNRCRYKHVKLSQDQPSENGHQSSWVPKATKIILKRKHQDVQKKDGGSGVLCTFSASDCPLGEKCSCIHGDQCVHCKKFCLYPSEAKQREKHLGACERREKFLKILKHSKEIDCNICWEHVLSKAKAIERKFGVLPECDHAFCLSCIKNWRNSAPASVLNVNNTAMRTCPVCRKLSYYVIPSTLWYSTKHEKQEIIDNYKTSCKLIDCKHFDSGNGNCPFGNNCFYKHTVKPGSYTWIHRRPPPRPPRRPTNMNTTIQFGLGRRELESMRQNLQFFSVHTEPLDMMSSSDRPGGSEASSDEEIDSFNLAGILETLDSDSETTASEDLDPFEFITPSTQRLGGSWWCGTQEVGDEEMGTVEELSDDGYYYYFGESDYEEGNPSEPSWLSMILHSSVEEDSGSSDVYPF